MLTWVQKNGTIGVVTVRRIRTAFTLAQLLLVVALFALVLGLFLSLERRSRQHVSAVSFSLVNKLIAASIETWSWEPYRSYPSGGERSGTFRQLGR